jgi:hypothetical protein
MLQLDKINSADAKKDHEIIEEQIGFLHVSTIACVVVVLIHICT